MQNNHVFFSFLSGNGFTDADAEYFADVLEVKLNLHINGIISVLCTKLITVLHEDKNLTS